jgi:peroxiredoxin
MKPWTIGLLALLSALASACEAASGASADARDDDVGVEQLPPGDPRVGAPLPALALPDCDGAPTALAVPAGARVLWLTLHAANCAACDDQHPALVDLWQRWRGRGLAVLLVLGDDAYGSGAVSAGFCRDYRAFNDLPFPVLRDDGFAALAAYVGTETPVQLLVGDDGLVDLLEVGWDPAFHPAWMEARLAERL